MIRQSIHKYPLFILILFSGFARAQFRSRAGIDSVKQTGFYAIKITPALSSLINTNFSDLRIVDSAGIRFHTCSEANYRQWILRILSLWKLYKIYLMMIVGIVFWWRRIEEMKKLTGCFC